MPNLDHGHFNSMIEKHFSKSPEAGSRVKESFGKFFPSHQGFFGGITPQEVDREKFKSWQEDLKKNGIEGPEVDKFAQEIKEHHEWKDEENG